MIKRQRLGGLAALAASATVVIGIAMYATALTDYTAADATPGESVAFLADHQATIYVWNLITLIGFGLVVVPLALALYDRLRAESRGLAGTAAAFGLIWAGLLMAAGMILNIGAGVIVDLSLTDPSGAESLWLTIDTVGNGLSGGMEIVGPIWVLLVSWAALRAEAFPRAMNFVGGIIGAAGLFTVVPALESVGMVFGLGLVVWLTWLGIVMLRGEHTPFPTGDDMTVDGQERSAMAVGG
jgi:hypothetical protein